MKAEWNGAVLAASDDTVVVEGNHYFPADSLNKEYFEPSERQTTCPWKGVAHYYAICVDGQRNEDAAWYYPETTDKARKIKDRIAFWNGVVVSGV